MSDPTDLIAAKIALAKSISEGKPPKIPLAIRKRLANRPQDKQELAEWMRGILQMYAVNEASIAAKIAEGLQAFKVMELQTGNVIKVPDYFTQHKYLETAVKMLDLYPPTKQQLTTDDDGIVIRLTPTFGAGEAMNDMPQFEVISEEPSASEED
jgi:hypothetical protein